VGKNKQWYDGTVRRVDKEQNETSIYFAVDKQTVVLNLTDPGSEDFLREGQGWRFKP
jgi:hypothetical protein